MTARPPPSAIWTTWLLVASAAVAASGFALVAAPVLARHGFSLLLYAELTRLSSFGDEATRYISLAHAVLGSLMFGWGVALFMVVRTLLARGLRSGWYIVAASVGAWFVPDTAYSLLSGYWQNALLNTGFLLLFAIPLAATRSVLDDDARPPVDRTSAG